MQDLVTCNVNEAGIKEGSKDEDRRKRHDTQLLRWASQRHAEVMLDELASNTRYEVHNIACQQRACLWGFIANGIILTTQRETW